MALRAATPLSCRICYSSFSFPVFFVNFCCRMPIIGQQKFSMGNYSFLNEPNNWYQYIANGFFETFNLFLKNILQRIPFLFFVFFIRI